MTPVAVDLARYPTDLESWWLQEALRLFNLRDPLAAAKELVAESTRLSGIFTSDRSPDFTSAYSSRLARVAYGNYFFPQTYVRTRMVLAEMIDFRGWQFSPKRPIRILDLGGGTGAGLIAATDLLRERQPGIAIEACLVDQSDDNLLTFRNLTRATRSNSLSRTEMRQGDLRQPAQASGASTQPWDLILVSFSLGEAFFGQPQEAVAAWLKEVTHLLHRKGLLLILEPALKETSTRLERLRTDALALDLSIWGPCLHEGTCPLLEKGTYWCHDARRWHLPVQVQRINNYVQRTIWDLKHSFLALGMGEPRRFPSGVNHLRLTSGFTKHKGLLMAAGCAADASNPHYQISRRDLSPRDIRQLIKIERGDIMEIPNAVRLADPSQVRVPGIADLHTLFPPVPATSALVPEPETDTPE